MELSTAEFDKQNYAGALYLASQAKNAAAITRQQLAGVEQGTLRPGEQPFALPLPLQTTTASNVRGGPGLGFEVRFVLPPDAPLTGYSSMQQWLRVADDSGRAGWISQNLIRRRP
jgi:SH3-like domain-containing protein